MLYRIIIKEVVSKVEYIEAEDQYGALEEAQRMYDNGEIDMEKEVEAEVDYTCVCEDETNNMNAYESIEDILTERICNASVAEIEDVLGYLISADVMEGLEDRVRIIIDNMQEDELHELEKKFL